MRVGFYDGIGIHELTVSSTFQIVVVQRKVGRVGCKIADMWRLNPASEPQQ